MESYLMKIVGPNINEYPNKHCKDNEGAMELARKMSRHYPIGTTISVYHVIDVDGRETKNYIGMVILK